MPQNMIDALEQQIVESIGMKLYKQIEGFSQEQLYLYGGRLDSVFTLSLRENTDDYRKYGDTTTVCFIYNRNERNALEKNSSALNNHPCIKAKLLCPNEKQCENAVEEMQKVGIRTENIVEIIVAPSTQRNNTFPSKEKRTPKIMKIPFNTLGKGRDIGWMYVFFKRLKEEGIGLMPEDKAQYLAFRYILEPELMSEEEKKETFDKEGMMNHAVMFHLLSWKQDAEIITEDEKSLLFNLKKDRINERRTLLEHTLNNMGLSLSRFMQDYPQQAILIFEKIDKFHDINFNVSGKYPLYMNFESLLHIYFRHTDEMNISPQFADRDKFQVEEKYVLMVMNIVMRVLNDEYQAFKTKNPEGRFFRSGEMAYYYNGDYYHVSVNANGCISTFYKGTGKKGESDT